VSWIGDQTTAYRRLSGHHHFKNHWSRANDPCTSRGSVCANHSSPPD